MLHLPDLRDYVIIPTLKAMGMYSASAVNLLLGTAIQESKLTYLKQIDGPAMGIYQMEENTHIDLWENYINNKYKINNVLEDMFGETISWTYDNFMLYGDLNYATALARTHYWRRPEPLPDKDDVEGLAKYWKKFWNTEKGKGTIAQFILHYNEYVREHAL